MKKILNNKKLVIISVFIILILSISVILVINNINKEPKIIKSKTYTMYVKINPIVKLTYKIDYYKCGDKKDVNKMCVNSEGKIVDYELLNNDAKKFYKDLNLNDEYLFNALSILYDTAKDNNKKIKELEIVTNYNNIDINELLEEIYKKSKYDTDINVTIDFKENIEESDILKQEEIVKEYTIQFDTNGGNKITNQIIKEGEKVIKPDDPIKNGYTFVEWQLNNETYDFDTSVSNDIILRAKWEKNIDNDKQPTTDNENIDNKPNNEPTPTPSSTPKPEVTPKPTPVPEKSTFNKINLNDNILVTDDWVIASCGEFWIFADDEEGTNYNESKTTAALNALKNLKNPGGFVFGYGLSSDNDKRIVIDLYEINLQGDYGDFGTEYRNIHNQFKNQINNILKDAYHGELGCGDVVSEKLLDENLCKQYSLNCSRW